jgi:hypothetical protein
MCSDASVAKRVWEAKTFFGLSFVKSGSKDKWGLKFY